MEVANVEFRAEVYNILNHTNFANPPAVLSNSLGISGNTPLQPGQPFTGPTSGGAFGIVIGILPWVAIFAIFYLLMIRPQQQRVKQHQAEIAAVKKGDEVVTGGGIRGRVTKVSDDEAEVEIAQGVKVKVVKSTITAVMTANAKPAND